MVMGRFEPAQSQHVDLKQVLRIGLDEAMTAIEECLMGLTDQQFWAFPIENRHNIVTLVEHLLDAIDLFACEVQADKKVLEHDHTRFDIARRSPAEVRPFMVNLPSVKDVLARLGMLRKAVMRIFDDLESKQLFEQPVGCWFFEEFDKTRADAYMRCITHAHPHIRQMWLLRGLLGLTDQARWPQQHWA